MQPLLEQIKKRRLSLALKQHDMMMRVELSLQQYQRLESKGHPRIDTLELIAKRLKSEVLLISQEKLSALLNMAAEDSVQSNEANDPTKENNKSLADNPSQGKRSPIRAQFKYLQEMV